MRKLLEIHAALFMQNMVQIRAWNICFVTKLRSWRIQKLQEYENLQFVVRPSSSVQRDRRYGPRSQQGYLSEHHQAPPSTATGHHPTPRTLTISHSLEPTITHDHPAPNQPRTTTNHGISYQDLHRLPQVEVSRATCGESHQDPQREIQPTNIKQTKGHA